jgi:hypothetical protein
MKVLGDQAMNLQRTAIVFALTLLFGITLAMPTLATTYHVKKTGSDSYSCSQAQNPSTPKATINGALNCIGTGAGAGAGATVRLYQGTYTETIANRMPGGASWNAPFTLETNPGDVVTLRPSGSCGILIDMRRSTTQYVILRGSTSARMVVDAANCTVDAIKITHSSSSGSSHHIRLEHIEVKNARNHGILVTQTACCNEFINVWVHHNGSSANTNQTHGFYVQSNNNVFDGVVAEYNWNQGLNLRRTNCGGAQCTTNTIVRNSVFRYNGRSGSGNGISYGAGENLQFVNNLFYKNAKSGLLCSTTASNAKIFNNTFWNNGYYAMKLADTNCTNTQIRNNIFWQNIPGNILNGGAGTTDSNNLTTDPKFIDPSKDDFRLQSGSPAIDQGATITSVSTTTVAAPQPAAPTQLQATSQ